MMTTQENRAFARGLQKVQESIGDDILGRTVTRNQCGKTTSDEDPRQLSFLCLFFRAIWQEPKVQ